MYTVGPGFAPYTGLFSLISMVLDQAAVLCCTPRPHRTGTVGSSNQPVLLGNRPFSPWLSLPAAYKHYWTHGGVHKKTAPLLS